MDLKIVLLLIGATTACVGVLGVATGRVYCKGGPYVRETQPVAFWLSIAVYFMWSALMVYFVFFRQA